MSDSFHKVIIITAPSGAGKTSITRHLMQTFPLLSFSVSATTRPSRLNEINGEDYYFLTMDEFQQRIKDDAFIEHEMVYAGVYYGTLKSEMERIWQNGKIPVLDIDVKGAMNVQRLYPGATLSLFIQPPSVEELRSRLQKRGTESPESLQRRLNKAEEEMAFRDQFDRIVINDQLEKACQEAEGIVGGFLGQTKLVAS